MCPLANRSTGAFSRVTKNSMTRTRTRCDVHFLSSQRNNELGVSQISADIP